MPIGNVTVHAQWTAAGLSGQALSVGREVTLGGEKFYVIEDSPASNSNVKLISKFDLNTAGTAQENARNGGIICEFSSSKYWSGNSENLNNNNAPAGSAYQKSKAYGAAKGGTGRLMTYDEANALKSRNTNVLYGQNIGAADNYLNYWLGTSSKWRGSNGAVWYVYGHIRYTAEIDDGHYSGVSGGVRPVVEVSKSKIT